MIDCLIEGGLWFEQKSTFLPAGDRQYHFDCGQRSARYSGQATTEQVATHEAGGRADAINRAGT